jgi:hypothetical protein
MNQTVVSMASAVASHTCAVDLLLNKQMLAFYVDKRVELMQFAFHKLARNLEDASESELKSFCIYKE